MASNLDILDFQLDDTDLAAITALDEGKSLFIEHTDPRAVEFLLGSWIAADPHQPLTR